MAKAKLNPNELYKSTEKLISGYSLTASYGKQQAKGNGGTGRKVYLIGRPLKSGNVSLIRYSFHDGERHRESTGKVLRVELDSTIKLANQTIIRMERAMCDEIEKELLMTGQDFESTQRGKMLLSEYLCPDQDVKVSQLDSVSRQMKSLVGHVKAYGDVALRDVNENWVRGFAKYLKDDAVRLSTKDKAKTQKLSQSTQNKLFVILSIALNRAQREKRIRLNPVQYLSTKERPHTKQSNRTFLELSEVKKLTETECTGDAHGYNIKACFLFCVNVGLRFSDVTKLRPCDFKQDENGTYLDITMQKTGEQLYIYVSDYALSLLPNVDDKTKPVFRIPGAKTTNYYLGEWVKAAGIEKHITFHCSRHSCATLLLSNGVNLQNVQAQLGHTNSATTQIYAKLVNAARKQTANRMDEIMSGFGSGE